MGHAAGIENSGAGTVSRSIVDFVGETPLLRLSKISNDISDSVEIYAKAEWLNPGGSVKDRAAVRMVLQAIKDGKLKNGLAIMDSSSGNTAIAYAMTGAALGFPVTIVAPENVNVERKKTIEAFGAKIIYSDPLEGSDGAIVFAHRLKQQSPDKYFMPDQYNNPLNPLAHYETTAPEIWEQTGGRVTHFVAGIGTSGTIMGVSRRLKELNPQVRTFAIEPAEVLHGLEGLKHIESSIVPGIYDPKGFDGTLFVSTEDAYAMMEKMVKTEGIFIGHSGGAAVVGALELARKITSGVIVTVLPDSGFRYLSEKLWW
ncbi:MAG: pyridoxal-phosphate dependent enzyme [Candidatus Mycalebacterium zealandia]|nr:MAG: pyridoxal-phosphate dependent enzyme [Candidatus Mycalebacterium zealandia]